MLEVLAVIEPFFRTADWKGPKKHTLADTHPVVAHAIAIRIVEEFGGLTVGKCSPGAEMATSDVRFYERLRSEESEMFQAWERQIGKVVAFASCHHDHTILSVGANGAFYVFTEPDSQLYAGPPSFGELMRRLLWGHRYGPAIPKDDEKAKA